jgi:hypothetical protein
MEYLFGIGVAGLVAIMASLIGFDKDRAFYPVLLIVIASYYMLFAAISNSVPALIAESILMAAFAAIAIVGFYRSPWFIVVGLAAHGAYDLAHPQVMKNSGVPSWWPGFCLGFDLAAAIYLAFLLRLRRASNAA